MIELPLKLTYFPTGPVTMVLDFGRFVLDSNAEALASLTEVRLVDVFNQPASALTVQRTGFGLDSLIADVLGNSRQLWAI